MYNEIPSYTGLDFNAGWMSPQYNRVYFGTSWLRYKWNDEHTEAIPDTAGGFGAMFDIDPASWRVSLAPLAAAAASLGNPGRGLAQVMNMAQAYYAAGDIQSACLMLAAFRHQASHAHGKALSQEMSDKLTADSTAVMDALGCN